MKKLLTKAFIVPFYKAFLGFFLILILVFGVFVKSEVHVMLGYQIIQSSYALAGLIFVFSFYSLLHWNFQRKLLLKSNYRIFHQLGLINPCSFYKDQLYVWLSNHSIIILYTAFLSALCFDLKLWGTLPILWGSLVVLYFNFSSLIYHQLRNPLAEITIKKRVIVGANSFKISYDFWFLFHLKENRPLLLLASKLVSLFLLNLFFSTFQSGGYDNRWLQFAILCISFVNLPLLIEKRDFEISALSYLLNMPVSFLKKFKSHFFQIIWIVLPELIFITYQILTTDMTILHTNLIFLTCALHLGLYGLFNYINDATKLSKYAFIAFFVLFFAILYNLPWFVLSTPALALFLLSIKSHYRN